MPHHSVTALRAFLGPEPIITAHQAALDQIGPPCQHPVPPQAGEDCVLLVQLLNQTMARIMHNAEDFVMSTTEILPDALLSTLCLEVHDQLLLRGDSLALQQTGYVGISQLKRVIFPRMRCWHIHPKAMVS